MKLIEKLEIMAKQLRKDVLIITSVAGSGHLTSCLSSVELMSCIFFDAMQKDDEFILSKGHAAPLLYSTYAESGFIKRKELLTLRKLDSPLEGHPTPNFPFVKVSTGSLGQGLSAGVGIAIAQKKEKKGKTYVLLGDGECAEGSIWEAANLATMNQLNNLIAIVDINGLGQSQETMHNHNVSAYERKFKAFGWHTQSIDGHSIKEILRALHYAKESSKPFAILAKTLKGKGISRLEGKLGWHGKVLSKEECATSLIELGEFPEIKLKSKIIPKKTKFVKIEAKPISFEKPISTREAFGKALVSLGKNKKVIVIDGDVQNSTMTQEFSKAYPRRFIQGYIAEQNMVGMALGLSTKGYTPIVSTFAAFLTRAHDQIRMASYSRANIKFIGSHAGISIGDDGPSQMGLEDISMFLSTSQAIIVYPSDALSAQYLLKEIMNYQGISYLRTTREATPLLYREKDKFPLGHFKVLRKSEHDKVLVIGSGITVHESLKAYELLRQKNIHIRVIVVEDHFFNGIGSVISSVLGKVKHLYVKEIPRSGKPEELRSKYGIDAT